jgi:K(+)-stimulated pyrophosphate-energized sodium pump
VAMSIGPSSNSLARAGISAVAILVIVVAVWNSKRKSIAVKAEVPGQNSSADEDNGAIAHV